MPLRSLAIAVSAALALAAGAATPALATDCANANLMPGAANVAQVDAATLCLLNEQRADNGLARLAEDPVLDSAATAHTLDMIDNQYFAHTSPTFGDLVTRLTKDGFVRHQVAWSIGENVGWGTGPFATPAEMVNAWMNSPDHRANILDATFTEIGLGIAGGVPVSTQGQLPGATYTTDFGWRSAPVGSGRAVSTRRVTVAPARHPAKRPKKVVKRRAAHAARKHPAKVRSAHAARGDRR